MSSTIFACSILSVVMCTFVLYPWFSRRHEGTLAAREDERRELLSKKERFLQSLRDLELDFSTGKLSKEDYAQSRSGITSELQAIYKEIDSRA